MGFFVDVGTSTAFGFAVGDGNGAHRLAFSYIQSTLLHKLEIMVVRLKPRTAQKQVKAVLHKAKDVAKPFDISRFAGALTWGQDAVEFRRDLRRED